MATVNIKKELISDKNFLAEVSKLYSVSPVEVAERLQVLVEAHKCACVGEYQVFSSPGRIEVVGNHTDHNNGKVVAAAVTTDTLAVVSPLTERKIVINSLGYPLVEVNIDDLDIHNDEYGTSFALVRGVLKGFKDRGYNVGGFYATTASQVFKGAGMSSSASFEVLVAEILNDMYNDCKIDAVTKAIVSQYAENVYFGKPSGLMDQAAIALGGVSYIDFKDTTAPQVKKPLWQFSDLSVVVVNCGGDHCDLTPQYAAIKAEMEAVASFFGEKKLRFVDKNKFYESIGELKKVVSGRAVLRAMHFFEENERVDALVDAINAGCERDALDIITASGNSSYKKLQNCYPDGDSTEPIPLALALCESFDGVEAYRVHGGGFAGTILTFVKNDRKDAFCEYMAKIFGKENVFAVGIRQSGTVRMKF